MNAPTVAVSSPFRSKPITSLVAAFVLVVCGSERATAGYIIYNTIDPNQNAGAYFDHNSSGHYGPLADSFSTGPQDLTLTDITVRLGFVQHSTTSVSVDIFSSNESGAVPTPGSLLAHIADIDTSPYTAEYRTFDFSNLSFQMAANQRYWVDLSAPLGGPYWTYAGSSYLSDVGVANEYSYYSSLGSFSNVGGTTPFQMQLTASETGTPSVATPEPSSIVSACIGCFILLGLAAYRQWLRTATLLGCSPE